MKAKFNVVSAEMIKSAYNQGKHRFKKH